VRPNLNKLAAFLKIAGTINGRTKFQKIIYILKNKNVAFSERFRYHYYGPYSAELQLEIDELVDMKILQESQSNPGYKYSLKSEFDNIEIDTDLQKNRSLINFLVSKDFHELELVSTIYYLRNNGYKNNKIINEKLKILKPHLQHLNNTAFETCEKIDTNF
jgi:uncharacterized protein